MGKGCGSSAACVMYCSLEPGIFTPTGVVCQQAFVLAGAAAFAASVRAAVTMTVRFRDFLLGLVAGLCLRGAWWLAGGEALLRAVTPVAAVLAAACLALFYLGERGVAVCLW